MGLNVHITDVEIEPVVLKEIPLPLYMLVVHIIDSEWSKTYERACIFLFAFVVCSNTASVWYNVILNTVPEAGS